ncbi:MAG: hypothetical protein CSB49_03115 [Proteobacteria bacterium]|nr:MAG: hypothetical protein CSB49_03115 [Pseudomonadota bacterium]
MSATGLWSRHGKLIVWVALGFAIAGLTVHALSYYFVSDDAYITFRYSWNLAFHGEAAFNLGERVEGYTNFLWMLLLALFLKLGIRPEVTSHILGILCGGAGVVLLYGLTRLYRGGQRTPWDLLGALLLPTIGGYAVWCSGGLETQLFCALCLAAITTYVAESSGRLRFRYSGGIFALAAMTRPEGLLLFGLTGLHRLARDLLRERRIWPTADEVLWFLGFAIPFGLFFWWRYSYYGYPFPNTYYVKAGGDHALLIKKWGLPYLWDFIHLNRLYAILPAALALFAARTTWTRAHGKARLLAELTARGRERSEGAGVGVDGWLSEERIDGVVDKAGREGTPTGPMARVGETGPLPGVDAEDEADAAEAKKAADAAEEEKLLATSNADEPAVDLSHAGVRPAFVLSYLALIALPFTAYVVYVGGDFMANGRFLLPTLPLYVFFAQEGLRELLERPWGDRPADSWRLSRVAPILILLLVGSSINARYLHQLNSKMSYTRWGLDTVAYLRKFASDRIMVGRWLRRHLPKSAYLAVGGAGAIVYASRLKALDTFGLNNKWIAHNVPQSSHRPGHGKSAPQHYILSQKPDLMCHRARHQDWAYRPNASEAAHWRRQGYQWVCVPPRGLRPSHYCCLKRIDRDLRVWPAGER